MAIRRIKQKTKKPARSRKALFLFISLISIMITILIYAPEGKITGFFAGGTAVFSADFEQPRADNHKLPAGFYLKSEHHRLYDPDADDADPGYEVADKGGKGLHRNAMLFDTTKFVDYEAKKEKWLESATIPVGPNKNYVVSLDAKYIKNGGDGDFATISLQQFDENFTGLDSDDIINFNSDDVWSNGRAAIQVQNNGPWKAISATFTTLPQASHVRFKINGYYLENHGRDEFLIDDFVFT